MVMAEFDRDRNLRTKVWFQLEANHWHGYNAEAVWVEGLVDGEFRILNTPFFAKGISYLDVVIADNEDGRFAFRSVLRRSGHSTYRIIVNRATTPEEFKQHWRELQELGCTYEGADLGIKLLAVDVPDPTTLESAYKALTKGEEEGVWDFEEGSAYIFSG
jgi:hypothetical protein